MKMSPSFEAINPTKEMVKQASLLNEGPTILWYKDGNAIRMETRDGIDPYVWRSGKWKRMKPGWGNLS